MANVKELHKLQDLTPDTANVNKGSERGAYMLDWSLSNLGAGRSILADADGHIIAGNKTLEAASERDLPIRVVQTDGKELVVVQRTDLRLQGKGKQRDMARQLAIADNRSSEIGYVPDIEQLLSHQANGIDISAMYYEDEIQELLDSLTPPMVPGAGGDEFETTPADGPTRCQVGDLWVIGGKHRLLCGDSTKAEDVARLMGGAKADMVFTDPPYGINYEGGSNPANTLREKLAGDTDGALYGKCMRTCVPYCEPSAAWYLWFDDRGGKPVYDAVAEAGYKVRAMIVWNKLNAHYGGYMAQYMQKHEPCLYCVRDAPVWRGPTNEVSVWDVPQPAVNKLHPTQKPIALGQRAILNSSSSGDVVADWFLGSGTTLIAAHRENRTCYGLEIEPRYCDVILKRAEAEGLAVERANG